MSPSKGWWMTPSFMASIRGRPYEEIVKNVSSLLSINPEHPDFAGWRAERIARTESMWAINEGMRQQYDAVGVNLVNIEPALSACDQCMDLAFRKSLHARRSRDALPGHPNCRCVFTGDFSDLLAA